MHTSPDNHRALPLSVARVAAEVEQTPLAGAPRVTSARAVPVYTGLQAVLPEIHVIGEVGPHL